MLIVGQIPFEETDRESFQEVDYRKMFAPLAKWVTQIDDAARIPELMAHAFDVARTGPYEITDLAFLPSGEMLTLERRFSLGVRKAEL